MRIVLKLTRLVSVVPNVYEYVCMNSLETTDIDLFKTIIIKIKHLIDCQTLNISKGQITVYTEEVVTTTKKRPACDN